MRYGTRLSDDAVQRALDGYDARGGLARQRRELEDAEAAFEAAPSPEAYERKIDAGIKLDMAQRDARDPDYHKPRTFGYIRREAQVTVPLPPLSPPACPQPRRTPRSRGAAHRPPARRTATRAGPSSDDPDLDDPEPASGRTP